MRQSATRGRALRYAGVLLTVLTAGCRTTGAPATAALEPAAACIVSDDVPRLSIGLALEGLLDAAHSPVPGNAAERIVFRQLYETLVTLDCEGRIAPGLAQSWSVDDAGRVWEFRLRADATFWDGQPVTARAVVEGWQVNAHRALHAFSRLRMTTALDARHLRVELNEAGADVSLFAQPAFAVARQDADMMWRIGSGPFRPAADDDASVIRLSPRGGRAGSIEMRSVVDPRRALDAGIDILITADPSVLYYARALPGYTSTPLTWSRTYALVSQVRGMPPPWSALDALARDAVRATARPADSAGACVPRLAAPPAAVATTRSLVYARDDGTARGIAERLVALAWPATRAPDWLRTLLPANYHEAGVPAALGVERAALADALRTRRALAHVIALPRVAGRTCNDAVLADDATARALLASGLHVTPLIDTRDYMIQRTGLGRVVLDGDGVIRFLDRAP